MGFSELDKLKALAIVHIFETSKPLGDYSAVAVLDDGAGISYGVNQFTHRSGSLYSVLLRFDQLGGEIPHSVAKELDSFRTGSMIKSISANATIKTDLRLLGGDPLMQRAQREIAFEKYLKPAIDACEGSDFTSALSLAVVYDSMNHGSWAKIRDRVVIKVPGNGSIKPEAFEREWISQYVRERDAWLESIPRLRKTDYRTDFFLAQIARGNWDLELPLNVHGYRLTDDHFAGVGETQATFPRTAEPQREPTEEPQVPSQPGTPAAVPPPAEAPTQTAENIVNIGDNAAVPADFVPEDKSVDAPPPTGFMAKLKAQGLAIAGFFGGAAGVKEIFGIQFSAETVELMKIVIPTLLVLGFIGFLVWYITEKVTGWKTLKLQSEIQTDPKRHNLKINPQ